MLLEQLGEGKLTEFHPIEAVLLVRDGVIELFSIEGKPPFAWVTAVMKALTPKKIIVYLPKSSTAQLPAGLKGAEVKKLPAEKISALWAEREDEQG